MKYDNHFTFTFDDGTEITSNQKGIYHSIVVNRNFYNSELMIYLNQIVKFYKENRFKIAFHGWVLDLINNIIDFDNGYCLLESIASEEKEYWVYEFLNF